MMWTNLWGNIQEGTTVCALRVNMSERDVCLSPQLSVKAAADLSCYHENSVERDHTKNLAAKEDEEGRSSSYREVLI